MSSSSPIARLTISSHNPLMPRATSPHGATAAMSHYPAFHAAFHAAFHPAFQTTAPLLTTKNRFAASSTCKTRREPVFRTPSRRNVRPTQMVTKRPFASRVASGALKLLIRSLCPIADNLEVDIDASGNRAVLSGQINAVSVKTSRICLNGLMVSGGAALYTDEISLQPPYPGQVTPRLAKPLCVSVLAKLTEADLNRDGPVRDGLEMLFKQILTTGLSGALGRMLPVEIGGVQCSLDMIELQDPKPVGRQPGLFWGNQGGAGAGGKLILHAHATLASGQVFRFSVRTGLCAVDDGNVVMLSEPELIWRQLSIPMVTIAMIGVKLDESTQLTKVEIDKGILACNGVILFAAGSQSAGRVTRTGESSLRSSSTAGRASSAGRRLPRGHSEE